MEGGEGVTGFGNVQVTYFIGSSFSRVMGALPVGMGGRANER